MEDRDKKIEILIRDIISKEIREAKTTIPEIETVYLAGKIEKEYFEKYGISISRMINQKPYTINIPGELKFAIDDAKENTSTITAMANYLKDKYGITMNIKTSISFKHPADVKDIAGNILSKDYTGGRILELFKDKSKMGKKAKENLKQRCSER